MKRIRTLLFEIDIILNKCDVEIDYSFLKH